MIFFLWRHDIFKQNYCLQKRREGSQYKNAQGKASMKWSKVNLFWKKLVGWTLREYTENSVIKE